LLDFKKKPYAAVDAPRMAPIHESNIITMEDRVSDESQAGLAKLGTGLKATPVYDMHMGSYQVCFRNERSGNLGATADPRRMGVADGLK